MRIWNPLVAAGCMVPSLALALTTSDFTFESGADSSNYSALGKPNDTYSIAGTLPHDTLDNVYSMLPEGTYVNSAFIAPERYSNIDIDDELGGAEFASAKVTFLNEGAGYRNALGYFVYDTNNPPASMDDITAHTIIFPNTSKAPDGEMVEGDTIDLGVELTAGQTLAFFVVPNGWGWSGSYNNIASLGNWGTPFYSYSDLNPENTASLRRHNVAFIDTENEFFVLGFEDLKRTGGDHDFNDLLFTVEVTPFTAVDGVNPDGSTDSKYEPLVQQDSDITITSVYPSGSDYATIAFEDRWPLMGDYDFNDVVWRYQITEQLNGQRELKNISFDYTLQAMGAGFSNGYGIHLPGVDPSNIANATLTRNGVAVSHSIVKQGTSDAVLIVSEDLKVDLQNLGELTESCAFYRTQVDCLGTQNVGALQYQLYVEFTTPVSRDIVGYPPYDSFIFAAQYMYHGDFTSEAPGFTWQTHLKQFSGTSDMNNAFFNTYDDKSDGVASFTTENNMPWAINIRDEWDHPIEYTDICEAYLTFDDWVEASGESHSEWYKTAVENTSVSATGE
ncbi:LruC domain-containing protein [Vibrio fortis]|uniref:LruC domain-containing protein n=1 Tax=Vibrio fortis TaxID=212667 RepID=A0A5N3R0L8_9VIBR|nr:LruC domain-containing protein [Vibrio fortis]KAB0288009.1 LruC domain-containing protein [Vibrio fortis]